MSDDRPFAPVALVPTFDNPLTIAATVEGIRARGLPVIVVDDGSGPEGERACAQSGAGGRATVLRLPVNRGKGAAVKLGLERAAELGFSHAFQIDGDGQHDLDAIARFVERARERPAALVLGYPLYSDDAPRSRTFARRFMLLWIGLETAWKQSVEDALIGFRVYPVAATLACPTWGDRMTFDIEIIVRLVRAGTPIVNEPVAVRYLSAERGGVSHFRMVRDNLAISWMHCRLCTLGLFGWVLRRLSVGGGR